MMEVCHSKAQVNIKKMFVNFICFLFLLKTLKIRKQNNKIKLFLINCSGDGFVEKISKCFAFELRKQF